MNTKQILVKAKQLLIDKGWTQGALARNADGRYVDPCSSDAVCFCAVGALRVVTGELYGASTCGFLGGEGSVLTFNDNLNTTKEMVLELFDKAIAKA